MSVAPIAKSLFTANFAFDLPLYLTELPEGMPDQFLQIYKLHDLKQLAKKQGICSGKFPLRKFQKMLVKSWTSKVSKLVFKDLLPFISQTE